MANAKHARSRTTDFTYHLIARRDRLDDSFQVAITDEAIAQSIRQSAAGDADFRYSPIFPAYLTPGGHCPPCPATLRSILFVFCQRPHKLLGQLRPALTDKERDRVFFSQGLASILLVNISWRRAREVLEEFDQSPLEFWPVRAGTLSTSEIVFWRPDLPPLSAENALVLPETVEPRLRVYIEQIGASIATLWTNYRTYFPQELETLRRLVALTRELTATYVNESNRLSQAGSDVAGLATQRDVNALIAGIVELSAALSYAVTQGTTGALPILSSRAPFPHRSLLGVGGAVRALTVFTRYLEGALIERSATEVVMRQYTSRIVSLPEKIAIYASGKHYNLDAADAVTEFDLGGAFPEIDHVPLLTQFSLRHGFKESKFAVTAPSESLSAETVAQWTLITLSHEIMHSRVRGIFIALFGSTWLDEHHNVISNEAYASFRRFVQRSASTQGSTLKESLKNVVLNFCLAMDRAEPVTERRPPELLEIAGPEELAAAYLRHKRKAVELFVHFHDFYFTYARQHRMYAMSIWASWIKVAAPAARPREYLVRSLATLACGTGLGQVEAYEFGVRTLLDGLEALEAIGVTSPLFGELRRLMEGSEGTLTQCLFDASYYLIDQVAHCFASKRVAERIDRLDRDPFAEGSTEADQYSATIYVYGEEEDISPIRFAMSGLLQSMRDVPPISDVQWLTAWNTLVISSQDLHT